MREGVDDDRGVRSSTRQSSRARRSGWIGTSRARLALLALVEHAVEVGARRGDLVEPGRVRCGAEPLAPSPPSISCRSTSFGSPTSGHFGRHLPADARRRRRRPGCTSPARSRSAPAPKCSPLQNWKPTASTTSARPVNGFFQAPRTASGWSSGTAPCAGAPRSRPGCRVSLGKLAQLRRGVRPEDAVAGDDQRPLGAAQQLDGALDRGAGRPASAARPGSYTVAPRRCVGRVVLVVEDVGRDLDQRRALRRACAPRETPGAGRTRSIDQSSTRCVNLANERQISDAVRLLKRAEAVLAGGMLAGDAHHGAAGERRRRTGR